MSEVAPKHLTVKEVGNNAPVRIGPSVLNEIRNPLTNIVLSLDLLELEEAGVDSKIYFDIIRRNILRVDTLVLSLLNHGVRMEVQNEPISKGSL